MDLVKKYGWGKCPDNNFIGYVNKCKLFSEDDELFSNFKRDPDYIKILEGGGHIVGQMALDNIKKYQAESVLINNLDRFKENDKIGNPILMHYESTDSISPATLRYVNNCIEIKTVIGEEKPKKIVEVGGGYGGLCKTFSVLYDFDEYVLVDLPEVVELCKKYLENFPNIKDKITYISCEDLKTMNGVFDVDLFISDSAFAECDQETQILYTDKIAKNSKFVYVTFNTSHISGSQDEMQKFINNLNNKSISTFQSDDKTVVCAK
jgi:putative sugar O-methyltransferase